MAQTYLGAISGRRIFGNDIIARRSISLVEYFGSITLFEPRDISD
jgi:hypothetical protein